MKAKDLAKFMTYMLGVDPAEFCLAPDNDNRYKIKDVLKALNELEGFKGVRIGDLKELTLTLDKPPIVIEDTFVYAMDTSRLTPKTLAQKPPKTLYTAVRGKAHAHVLREGITPTGAPYVLMTTDRETALTIGRRIDNEPVIIEVKPYACMDEGVIIYEMGRLFMADYLPPYTFNAPPLPKETVTKAKPQKAKHEPEAPKPALTPGSFFLDLYEESVSKEEKQRRTQKDKKIKQERQIARKQKRDRNQGYE